MTEPEPSGWELMRAIRELRASVDKVAAGMITQSLFAAFQQAQRETDDRQDARLKQLEADRAEEQRSRVQQEAERRKERAQQWFAVVMAIVTGVVSLGVALIVRTTA